MYPLILALIHRVPVVGFGRSNKVKQLATRVGFDLINPETESQDAWLAGIRTALDKPAPDISQMQRLAHEQFGFQLYRDSVN